MTPRIPGVGPKPEGGPARPGPSSADLAPGDARGTVAARGRRGTELPHPAAQKPLVRDPDEPRSYYGRPVIKSPVWKPQVPFYFWTGGLAGTAAPLALLAEVRGEERLARAAWVSALAGAAASPVLLITDLGVPGRFLYMLRVFKVTSPMSVGTWILTVSGTSVGLAATRSVLGWFPRLGRAGGVTAAALGPALSTYTALLITDTAVPAWHEARRELPFLFAASSAATAGGVVSAVLAPRDSRPARLLAIGGSVLEVAVSTVMERRLGELASAYREGPARRYGLAARAAGVAGAGLLAAAGGHRAASVAGGALTAAGALLERWSVFKAGFASAADPRQTVGPQRRRLEARRNGGPPAPTRY